ncbi:ABC transporter ATP-binding protein [Paratissierella segnis]|jgi:branched-chain amino acid transport system ATP-binding protein|uniref:ABC transporter ATP-binding protein n=1 Tax=Paratissierella segnis TaxID=2763679 RepID=A0A926ETJ1_9FIRM|nr:ABC transporter ATP-binding protein [Paratissierella segnis]MBC8588611.1 ABC transporter ATP-binding protein [Paratissierella segnis]
MSLLEIENLTVEFGGLKALSNVNLEVNEGDFLGLIGPNGAGKTTLFNAITGVVKPSDGDINFEGKNIKGMRPDKIALRGISRTFQNIRLFPKMKASENVEIGIIRVPQYSIHDAILGLPKQRNKDKENYEQALRHLEQVGILEYKDAYAGELPYGIQRRLEIARAIATNPKILFLDEPAAGMNNDETKDLINFLSKLHKDTGITIVLIEHHLDVVMELCKNIMVLNLGSTLAYGNPKEIQSNPDVIKAYIGERRQKTNV